MYSDLFVQILPYHNLLYRNILYQYHTMYTLKHQSKLIYTPTLDTPTLDIGLD